MEQYDIAVIGAGPAGLFCAIQGAGPYIRVLLLEKNLQPGVKLLVSGTGQCNITHEGDIQTFFSRYGIHGKFLRSALLSCTNADLIRFFEERGLPMEATYEGKVFPVSRKAGDVCDVLIRECRRRGIDVRCGEAVNRVEYKNSVFVLSTDNQQIFCQKSCYRHRRGILPENRIVRGRLPARGIFRAFNNRDWSGTHPAHD